MGRNLMSRRAARRGDRDARAHSGRAAAEPASAAASTGLPEGEPHKLERPRGPALHVAGDRCRRRGSAAERVRHLARAGEPPRRPTNGRAARDPPAGEARRQRRLPGWHGPAQGLVASLAGRPPGAPSARRRPSRRSGACPRPTSTSATPTTSARPCRGLWMLASLYFRGRGARPREHSGGGPGAARGQPLGREHDARHERVHARLQHLLRRGAALLPAGPQPGALDARARLPAQVRHGGRHAGERRARRSSSGAALLVYPGGDYEVHRPDAGSPRRVDFGGRKGFLRLALEHDVPIVPGGVGRRPGDGALPHRAARAWPGCCGSTACSG